MRPLLLILLAFVVGATPTPPQELPEPGRCIAEARAGVVLPGRPRAVQLDDLAAVDAVLWPPFDAGQPPVRLLPRTATAPEQRLTALRPPPRRSQGPPALG